MILLHLFASLALAAQAVLAATPSLGPYGSRNTTSQYRFLSYNVRFDSQPDDITVQEALDSLPFEPQLSPPETFFNGSDTEMPWSTRRNHVANDVLFNHVDFFGGQEILIRQLNDLQELLGDSYEHIGIGRNGGNESEFSPIFWKKSAATLESWDTFWLTETPFDISFYPGTTNRRICTAARFLTSDGTPLTFLNTHLDHEIDEQRRYGLSLVLHRAKYEAIKTGGPVVLTGDFNSRAVGENSGGYQIITGNDKANALNETFLERFSWTPEEQERSGVSDDFAMKDLLGQAPPRFRSGHWATFTGFNAVDDTSSYSRIDYIMAGSNGGWSAHTFHVGETLHDDGVHASDHRPVYADLSFE